MDDVFTRLMDAAGVAEEDRPQIVSTLKALKTRYPQDTPARLFARAQKQGAPIPRSRCQHGVPRGDCVACDPRIGSRWYFTAGGRHVHATPTCPALVSGQDRVEGWGGSPAPMEVAEITSGIADVREPCSVCVKTPAARRPRARPSTPARPARPASRPRVARIGNEPRDLTPSSPPAAGDRIVWGGYSGLVTNVTDRGVAFSVDGVTLTAPWGERATLHPRSP